MIDLRKSWAELVNQRLEAIGSLTRVDHRSHQARGINKIPQIHLGHRVCQLRKRGIVTDRGDRYQRIGERNQAIERISESVTAAIKLATGNTAKAAVDVEAQEDLPVLPVEQEQLASLPDVEVSQPTTTTFKPQSEDLKSLARLVANTKKSFQTNSWLAAKAITKGYEPESIKRILIHSQHTKSLSPEFAQRSIDDAYRLASIMQPSWNTLVFERQVELPTETDLVSKDAYKNESEYIPKISISITDIIIGLLREDTTVSSLREILAQFDLAISHSKKTGVLTIYELGNSYQEYVSACWTDSGLDIVSDYLPKALKLDIFEKLLKIEVPLWLPNYFDSVKFLKHRALRKGENHYHPFALVSIAELCGENELTASEISEGFERGLAEASSQEVVASYSKPRSNVSPELNNALKLEVEHQEISTTDNYQPNFGDESDRLTEPQTATLSEVINVSPKQQQQQQKKSTKRIDATELIRMGLIRLPQYQLSRRKQQKLARRASALVAKILNFLKVTQTEDERYKICYDPKISRIEIIDVACQKSVLTASYHQGSSVWVADLSNSNINEDVVKYLTNKLEVLQKPKTPEDQSEQTSRFAQYKVTKDKSQNQSPKLNRQKKKGFEL